MNMSEVKNYFNDRIDIINIAIRSTIFNILFFLFPFIFIPMTSLWAKLFGIDPFFYQKNYARFVIWICEHIMGIKYKIYGIKNLPKNGKYIIASKHQSAWDSQIFNFILPKAAIIFKKELEMIPFIKPIIKNSYLIPIDRKASINSVKKMYNLCQKYINDNAPIIIFPEGTRVSPNQKTSYKTGVYAIYKKLNVPVIPVALNSGLFWERRAFIKKPGTIQVHFLSPIQPGFDKKEFMEILENMIEDKTKTITKYKN